LSQHEEKEVKGKRDEKWDRNFFSADTVCVIMLLFGPFYGGERSGGEDKKLSLFYEKGR
jgi:hypothetical protein